jgi:hypothetical protein
MANSRSVHIRIGLVPSNAPDQKRAGLFFEAKCFAPVFCILMLGVSCDIEECSRQPEKDDV